MVRRVMRKLVAQRKEDVLISLYLFGNAAIVLPMFTGIIIMPFLFNLDVNLLTRLVGLWWILVGFVNAFALYFVKKGKLKRAKYFYGLSAALSFVTGAAFWVSFFITLICIALIHTYERV